MLRIAKPEESISHWQTIVRLNLLITGTGDRKRVLRLSPKTPLLLKVWFDEFGVTESRDTHTITDELVREVPGIHLIEAHVRGDDVPNRNSTRLSSTHELICRM